MVTPAILAEHGVTGLDAAAYQRLIDDANTEIEARYGPLTPLIEEYTSDVGFNRIWTKRKILSITTVKHGPSFKASELITLIENADDGFMIVMNNKAIARLGGTFQRYVRVTYVPVDDEDRRDRVVIDLIKLSVRYNVEGGMLTSKSVGSLSESYGTFGSSSNYNDERENIINSLSAGQRNFA